MIKLRSKSQQEFEDHLANTEELRQGVPES